MNFLQRQLQKLLGIDKAIEQKAFRSLGSFQVQGGRIVAPIDQKQTYITDGYSANDVVFAVTNMVMDKVRLPEWSLYKVVNESSLKSYKAIMRNKWITAKDYKKAMMFRKDAIEPITNFNLQMGKLNDLLTYPNPDETFQDQIANGCGWKIIVGDIYLAGKILDGGANSGIPNELNLLPAHLMNISINDEVPARAVQYELFSFNQTYSPEEILHEKYWNPNWNINGSQLYGMAALKAAYKNLVRNNSAKDASTAKFQNGGFEAVLSFGDSNIATADPKFAKDMMQNLKLQLAEEYGGAMNQGKKVVSGYPINVSPLGLSPVDLGIIDSEKWDALMFCNIWGVPAELLGLVGKTFNNVKEAEKALTTRSALPLLTSRRNHLNRKFQSDWGFKGSNVFIDYDTECFGELTENINDIMDGVSKITMITPNEEREMAGMDARQEPEADEVWVLQGGSRVPLSDYQANPVDQILNNANGQANMGNGNGGTSANDQGNGGVLNGNAKDVRYKKKIQI